MAYMARAKTVAQEIDAYARLKTHIQSFRYIVVLDFDEGAAVKYRELRVCPISQFKLHSSSGIRHPHWRAAADGTSTGSSPA